MLLFTQLHTVTANFDLMIVTAQIFDIAVVAPAANVAGAVHAGAGGIAERVGQENARQSVPGGLEQGTN